MKTAKKLPTRPADHSAPKQVRRVLLVNEPDETRQQITQFLRNAGYDVTGATTGPEALTLCRETKFDIVIANWSLPCMSTLEFCRAYRVQSGASYGSVILMMPRRDMPEILAALEAGADDFLKLPLAPAELEVRLTTGERMLRVEESLRNSNDQLRSALDKLRDTQTAMERDLREARKLQQGLVRERSGRWGPFDLSLLLRPAGHIGGDLVNFFPIDDSRVGFYALDVSGHGVTAALLTAQLSVHLSGSSDQNVALRAAQSGSEAVHPAALAHFFNNMMLEEMITDSYFTMIYAELNHKTGKVQMVQAGHPHPVLQRADGRIEEIGAGGMPIGVVEDPIFDEIEFTMQPGDRLMVASDGVIEARSPAGHLLGEEGLRAIMQTNAFLSGHAFLESMAWSVSEYCRGERPDDMSAVLLEYRKSADTVSLRGS